MSVRLKARLRHHVLKEIKLATFWKAVFCEFVASALFIVMACGVSFEWTGPSNNHIALSTGLGVAMLAHMFWEVSGGQFNPAVAVATALAGKISGLRCFVYIVVQVLGCLAGSALMYGVTPSPLRKSFARLQLGKGVSPAQGFFVEFILTFNLIWTILAGTEPGRLYPGYSAPLAIGMAVAVGIYIGIPYTGAAMNPLRAFGPAVIEGYWPHQWIYWVGPISSAIFTTVLYKYIAHTKEKVEEKQDKEEEEQAAMPLTSCETVDLNAS